MSEKPEQKDKKKEVLTRISIQSDGSMVVTDMWEEVADLLFDTVDKDFEKAD